MQVITIRNSAGVFTAVLLCALVPHTTLAQQKSAPPADQSEEVVRTRTELVQTDVMVFDKQGKFYDGLKQEQFELRVDKKPRTILFFERITTGSANEEAQLAAARGGASGPTPTKNDAVVSLDRGRTVFFYLDDLHLSAGSMAPTRKMLLRFIEREMGQNDEAAITSASGQIGFLQQLTDNKVVLRQAVDRLRARPYSFRDGERPPMTEYQALRIENNDLGVLGFFVDELVKQVPGIANPEEWVRSRARRILEQAAFTTTNTLTPLENLIASSRELPGRKLVFFVSDGFFLDQRREALDRLRRLTNEAARSGVVIYTIDARGLIASLTDASTEGVADPSGRLARAELGEIASTQDSLNALARDTGGRPLFNTNDLSSGVTRALTETSAYYLIAWRPETEDQHSGRFNKIDLRIVGHPDLVMRLRRGFAEKESPAPAVKTKPKLPVAPQKEAEDELRSAIKTPYPAQTIRTALVVAFLDEAGTGSSATAAIKATIDPTAFMVIDGKPTADIDLGGIVYTVEGKVAGSFQTRITVKSTSPNPDARLPDNLSYNHQFKLKPGLYQVRIAVRDEKTGHIGGARQWIEIPDLTSGQLVLGSLILGEKTTAPTQLVNQANPQGYANLSIDHRFARTSHLRFLAFVYNATRRANSHKTGAADVVENAGSAPTAAPDVAIQVQVLREDQPVLTTTLRSIEVYPETDVARLPYAAELPLSDMQPGRYVLQVTVIDRIARTSATQQASFTID